MIKEGKIDAAEKGVEGYRRYATRDEEEIEPETYEEARRSTSAVNKKIAEIEKEIDDDGKEFVEEIKEKEKKILTSAELSAKIKELCETLAEVDPNKYAEVCRTNEDSPKWQKRLDQKLTEEQKKEAREFEKIMLQCMQTEGRECRCEDISIKPFAEKCSLVAPLATKCDNGDEEACEIMNEATQDMEDLLPPHLQEVLFITEDKIRGEQFDRFMPPECKKAGVKSPEECMIIMFKENAPEECVKALEDGRIDIKNERDARTKCEEIMFEENAPEECVKAGIKNGKECGTYMCENNLPEECKAAGLSCEQPNKVFRKCDEIMRSQRDKGQEQGQGFGFGRNCMEIQDKDEKLKCFEETFSNVQGTGFPGKGPEHFSEDYRGGRGSFPPECTKAGIDGSGKDDGERCKQIMISSGEERRKQTRDFQENFARDCRAKGGAWDCSFGDIDSSNPCRCYVEERRDYRPPQGEFNYPEHSAQDGYRPPENFRPPEGFQPPQGCFDSTGQPIPCQTQPTAPPSEQTQPTTPPDSTPGTETSSGSSGTSQPSESTGTSGSSTSETSSGITGGVIMEDNRFIDYYFKF